MGEKKIDMVYKRLYKGVKSGWRDWELGVNMREYDHQELKNFTALGMLLLETRNKDVETTSQKSFVKKKKGLIP